MRGEGERFLEQQQKLHPFLKNFSTRIGKRELKHGRGEKLVSHKNETLGDKKSKNFIKIYRKNGGKEYLLGEGVIDLKLIDSLIFLFFITIYFE